MSRARLLRLVVRASPRRRHATNPELDRLVGEVAASVVVAAAPAGADGSVMSTEVVVIVVAAAVAVAVVVVQCRRLRRLHRRSLPSEWAAVCLRSCSPRSPSPVVHVLVPVPEPSLGSPSQTRTSSPSAASSRS